jgi:hypothetical protein
VTLHLLSLAGLFIYSPHGKWVCPPLLWSFPTTTTFTSFPAPSCWAGATTPAFSGWLIYLQFHKGLPLPHLWHSGHPPLFATCLFCCYCLLFSFFFSFFPGWRSVCPGGNVDLAQGCLWEYCVPLSSPSQAVWALASGCMGALLVSPFNVKLGCCAWGGGVEESKFCLFSVVFPVMCISSVSPRFYFRKHAFCFLPLAAILESLSLDYFKYWHYSVCQAWDSCSNKDGMVMEEAAAHVCVCVCVRARVRARACVCVLCVLGWVGEG